MARSTTSSDVDWRRRAGERSGFQRYYETLREHVWLIVACTVVTVAAAAAYVAAAPRTYTAQAELLVNPAASQNTVVFPLPVLHTTGDPTRDVLTAAGLVTTPEVARAVIGELHLSETPSQILKKIQASPLGQSNLVALQAQASTAGQAQQLSNAFVTQAIAVRTAALHAALAQVIPGLKASVVALPLGERAGAGSLGDQLGQLKQLQKGRDPTLAPAAPAELPTGPTSPKAKLSIAAGLFGGLILGIGAAFAVGALDPRVRREEQLRELFGSVPVLARVPRVAGTPKPGPLLPADLPVTALEGYRTLRTTLATREGRGPRAYLLTSSAPSEGKTTSAIGLAVALAQGGGRVILIEADLRRPMISSALGLKVDVGIEQVLIGEVELGDALTQVRFDGRPLHVLAAHRSGVELADRLSYVVARRLVEDAKGLADFVVIDSPPLTSVIDALPLAQIADEVLVVIRLGQSRLAKLSRLGELLRQQDADPSGLVLIGVTGGAGSGYDYYSATEEQHKRERGALQRGQAEPVQTRSPST